MPNILKEVRELRQEGKLHQKLVTRVRMLLVVSLVLAAFLLYNLIGHGAGLLIVVALVVVGFAMGMFVFSRMSPIQWNEEQEVVETGRLGALGWITVAAYAAFEIAIRTFLSTEFPVSATAYVLATIFGVIFGRALGMILEIHRIYRTTHA